VYREVIALCELQEMDYASAAEIVQCPIGTIRSRLHRARAILMRTLACAPLDGGPPCRPSVPREDHDER
jgi:DNA-directed RNA polymerase specialized sigma24 family protein